MSEQNEANQQFPGGAKPLPEVICKPSVWPVTVALGVTLLAFGVVTHWMMYVAGMGFFLFGAAGWFEDLRYD
jgi:hypothetical protein